MKDAHSRASKQEDAVYDDDDDGNTLPSSYFPYPVTPTPIFPPLQMRLMGLAKVARSMSLPFRRQSNPGEDSQAYWGASRVNFITITVIACLPCCHCREAGKTSVIITPS